ncbi:kinase-like domain-containing protein [Xylaria acuta]|nr:kinase-like domain-containing protein [Xylaria acuta]
MCLSQSAVSRATRCRVMSTLPSLATPATMLFVTTTIRSTILFVTTTFGSTMVIGTGLITTGIGSTMVLGTGILGLPPLPPPVAAIVATDLASAARGFLVTEKPNARTAVIVGGHEFLVIEDSAFRRTLLAVASLSQGTDDPVQTAPAHRITTPNCVGDSFSTGPGSIYVRPPLAVGSNKCTCPFVVAGDTGLFRPFLVPVPGTATSFSRSRYAPSTEVFYSFHYPGYNTSALASHPFHRVSLPPQLSFHNLIYPIHYSIENRLLQSQPQLYFTKSTSFPKACTSCSVIDTSTATQHSPFFAESFRNISLYDFDATVILPFKELAWKDKRSFTSHIGFSCVSKIWISPAHHNFHDTIKLQENIFALKKLRSDRIEDFKREARALQEFAIYPHEHIVRLLAAFRHAGSFYLLFPWARGGSLRSFWRAHPQPKVNTEVSTWVAEQSLGIAAALHEIHRQPNEVKERNYDYGQQCASIQVSGYHGDIKPENILLFGGDRLGSDQVWKIGDFGVSKRFLVATHGGDIPKGFTPTYQSPEHQIEGRIDGYADIWSLGCVLLETVVWLLWGWDGLVRFGLMRQAPSRFNGPNNINSDTFFDIVGSSLDTVSVPVLKPSVLQCIEGLSCDPNVCPYLADLLHLIRRYLLNVNKHSRLSSELLVKVLRQLHQRCVDTPAYTVAMPRPQKPPIPTTLVHCESNNRCIADLSTPSNPATLKTTSRMILTYIARSRNTALRTSLHRDPAMALGSDAPTSSQWLDDYIGQRLYDFQTNLDSPTQEPFDDIFKPGIPEDSHLSSPNPGTHPGRRRGFSSITGPDDEDCHRKTKYQKRGETLQRNMETNPPLTDTSLPSNTLSIPQLASPSTAVSMPRAFACPFSKKSRDKYLTTKDWKCCLGPGPGWTIHRLKEHLYRKHASPNYQCPRCLTEFEDNSDLHQHQRSTTPCPIHTNAESGFERIDAQQVIQLKKKSRLRSDEEKWNDIYRIIFRLDPTADLPSPYYEDITPVSNIEPSPYYGADSLSQFHSYLQNRLQGCHQTQQNTSTIQACMDLVQGFRKTTGDLSLPVSEAPSLVFDNSAFSTMSYEYQPSASTTLSTTDEYNLKTSHEFESMSTDALAGFGLWDDSFESRFNRVFGLVTPEASAKPVPTPQNLQQREGLG